MNLFLNFFVLIPISARILSTTKIAVTIGLILNKPKIMPRMAISVKVSVIPGCNIFPIASVYLLIMVVWAAV